MKKSGILKLIVGAILFVIGVYVVFFIRGNIDFKTTQIIINDNPNLWKFMAFLPIMIIMLSGAFSVINSIIKSKILSLLSVVINIGLLIFLRVDMHGFVSVVPSYNNMITWNGIGNLLKGQGVFEAVLVLTSLILIVDIIISIVKNQGKKKTQMNFEQEI